MVLTRALLVALCAASAAAIYVPQDMAPVMRAPRRVDNTWDAVSGRVLSAGVHAHTQVTSRSTVRAVEQPPGLRGGGSGSVDAEYAQKMQLAELMLQEHIACDRRPAR